MPTFSNDTIRRLPGNISDMSKLAARDYECYGRLAVVSDLDDGGFALNVNKELRGSAVL
jgi:hypothetical protein